MLIKEKKSPGEKIIKNMSLSTRWRLTSILSYFILAVGLIFFNESFFRLRQGYDKMTWSFIGIISSLIFFSGLAIFGKSLVYKSEIRSRKIWKEKQKEKQKAFKKKRAEFKTANEKLTIQKNPLK
jgi:hypothetical protein